MSSRIRVGLTASTTETITEERIVQFSDITGDRNPLHLDPIFASKTMFGRRIAHGMLSASLISRILGNQLPGAGSIYLEQTIKFRRPVFIGDTITAIVEIIGIEKEGKTIILDTKCINQSGKIVIEGQATMLMPTTGFEE